MKKLLFAFVLACLTQTGITASTNYRINEAELQQITNNSTEVSFEELYASDLSKLQANFSKSADSKTMGGYLLRCWFCGCIAMHRYYMGTNNGAMWALYCCVPVVGGVAQLVDFFWVIFDDDAMKKYENNDKYLVWLD